jgi:hypothetical protein
VHYRTGFAPAPGRDGRHDAHAVEPGAAVAVCGAEVDVVVESEWALIDVRRCRRCRELAEGPAHRRVRA